MAPHGSANVSANAIDIDSPEFAAQFGAADDDNQDQAAERAIAKSQKARKSLTTKTPAKGGKKPLTAAQQKKADAAVAKAKAEKEAAKAKAKAEREAKRAAGPDLTGLVDPKALTRVKLVNVPVDALDGIDGGDPVEKSFVQNVKLNGVLTPIRVREYTAEDGETRYNIIYGKRRSQAARALELATIPAIVEPREGANDYVQALAENYGRSNNVIEENRMVQALLDHLLGEGVRESEAVKRICAATGMTKHQVKRARDVGRLLPELQTAVEEGNMTAWSALSASRLDSDGTTNYQAKLVEILNTTGKVTSDDVLQVRRNKQYQAVKATADGMADEDGEDMYDAPSTGTADGAAATGVATAPKSRVEKAAAAVVALRRAQELLASLSGPSDDEADAITFVGEAISRLTTASDGSDS